MSENAAATAETQTSAEELLGVEAASASTGTTAGQGVSTAARQMLLGVLLLAVLAGWRLYSGWQTWGNLSTDSGREIYVSLVVKDGGTLYRDVWYPYGPLAPYANALLFRVFGVHLLVPYVLGTMSALGSAIFLFLAGRELEFAWAGWTAGAVVILQAFEPGLFSFPVPYSSAAVYACFFSCAFLWLLLGGLLSRRWAWSITTGLLAALALLSKPEFGLACYPALLAAVIFRGIHFRDAKQLGKDVAGLLPGLALAAYVLHWMISIRGFAFITQENVMMWPTSYFLKTFGREWLAYTGFDLSWGAFRVAVMRMVIPVGTWVVAARMVRHLSGRPRLPGVLLTAALLAGLVAYWRLLSAEASLAAIAQAVFFPAPLVFATMVGALGALWYFLRGGLTPLLARRVLLLGFAGLLAFRVMYRTVPEGFPNFYDGPAVLGYLLLITLLIRAVLPKNGAKFRLEYAALAGCLVAVYHYASLLATAPVVPLYTAIGTFRVSERAAQNYQAAIAFMKEKKARGETVMVLPEDTMLYVLSGTRAPTRVNEFLPGFLAPGNMTEELFRQMEAKNVKFLVWSNRKFPQYGVPIFGQDFNQELARYLTARFKPTVLLVPPDETGKGLTFMVWEREAAAASE
jgi:hypothetical protein